jgi:uncharacterized coiled-coil DUF342 family protein
MNQSVAELLTEITRLRKRLEATQPNSARLSILMRDEVRLQKLLMPNHLTPDEQRRLEQIEAALAPLKQERSAILNRARQRRHYAGKQGS